MSKWFSSIINTYEYIYNDLFWFEKTALQRDSQLRIYLAQCD
jgi:hypothetical protein